MGNVNTKKEEESVDGGGFQPHGIYSAPQDFDHKAVRKLIQDRRLSPFYKGQPDLEFLKVAATDSQRNRTKRRSSSVRSRNSSARLTLTDLYRGAVECPICFLYYPRNINYSRCCEQPICTECFVQIKRPEATGTPAVCPFCVRPHFGVLYKPPKDVMYYLEAPDETHDTSHKIPTELRPTMPDRHLNTRTENEEEHRRKAIDYKHPDVVTSDEIRPDYFQKLQTQSHTIANAARILSGEAVSNSNRHSNRRRDHGAYIDQLGGDLEEMMVMEAIRQSIIEEQEREERERHEKQAKREAQEELSFQSAMSTERSHIAQDTEIRSVNTETPASESHTSNNGTSEQQRRLDESSLTLKNSLHSNDNDPCEA
ncbi:hypothetical protein K493DRAFT_337737 [Basidiobolus meristosporus CBS 931.73]|uniref:RING-type domain-containing protein n=1 Tax=Basidiobolus meristosporus CBS 931.73 TaxID=1314790 RepID=A0A1Y1Y9Z5_9FUNG|nr:hypothetical protein K493DRAFT_337737 [Basidiobolus meristosporus CBS 931.73]|eukprot:ORX94576.1 hypothetical protein K493DRAFT_337737 [Basidiobolus meristosporus CBS 931.73]